MEFYEKACLIIYTHINPALQVGTEATKLWNCWFQNKRHQKLTFHVFLIDGQHRMDPETRPPLRHCRRMQTKRRIALTC